MSRDVYSCCQKRLCDIDDVPEDSPEFIIKDPLDGGEDLDVADAIEVCRYIFCDYDRVMQVPGMLSKYRDGRWGGANELFLLRYRRFGWILAAYSGMFGEPRLPEVIANEFEMPVGYVRNKITGGRALLRNARELQWVFQAIHKVVREVDAERRRERRLCRT